MISVIIPAYNRQDYIEKCVQSALSQSLSDIEIIIVDDGSTDGTGTLCDSLAQSDGRIKVIHQENAGVSAARQAGIDIASGEWICFLDSDDSLPADALLHYSEVFAGKPDIIVSGYSGELDVERFLLGITDYSICPALWGKLFKAGFLKKNMPMLPRELLMGEDMIANLVLGMNAGSFATIPELQYKVTLDNSSSVMKTFRKSFEYENYFFRQLDELFLGKCPSLPYYDELVHNSVCLKLNGYKNVVLNGNRIETESDEWIGFVSQIQRYGVRLGPSEKLFFKMQHCQKLYGIIMNLYLRIRK